MGYIVGISDLMLAMTKQNGVYRKRMVADLACALAAAARLGADCRLITELKTDIFAKKILAELKELNINADAVIMSEEGTNPLVIHDEFSNVVSYVNNPAFSNMLLTDVELDKIEDADVCIFSSSIMQSRISKNTVMSIVRFLKGNGVNIFFDCAYVDFYWQDTSKFSEIAYEAIKVSDICHLTERELCLMSGTENKQKALKIFEAMNPDKIIIISSDSEIYLRCGKYEETIKTEVYDVPGFVCARGAMTGGILHKYLQLTDKLTPVTEQELCDMIKFGAKVKAATVKNGGELWNVPTMEDVIIMQEEE